jgi:hypothetical protein
MSDSVIVLVAETGMLKSISLSLPNLVVDNTNPQLFAISWQTFNTFTLLGMYTPTACAPSAAKLTLSISE